MIETLKHEVEIGDLTRKANIDDVVDKVNELIDVVNLMIEQQEVSTPEVLKCSKCGSDRDVFRFN